MDGSFFSLYAPKLWLSRSLRTSWFVSVSLSLTLWSVSRAETPSASEKKVIYYGWSSPDTGYVRDHWPEMERMPFDGVGIGVALDRAKPTRGDGSTGNLLGWNVFGTRRFHLSHFNQAITDLRTPQWTKFTDNFLPAAIATRDQDQQLSWFDDARWATIENNWRVLITIAAQGGCRGILLDPEHYDYECELFRYAQHRAQRADRPFASYQAVARARGRQLGAAAREIFPNITIAMLYGYTLPATEARGRALETTRYALLPAFLDGLLESSDPAASFVDLWEYGHGYRVKEQFLKGFRTIKNDGRKASEVPAIYDQRVKAGFSLRLDYAPHRARWHTRYLDRNYFTPARFQRALHDALEVSERYVWIYSEASPGFFPPQQLPAEYLKAMAAARQPESERARAELLKPLGAGALGLAAMFVAARRRRATHTAMPRRRATFQR